MKITELLVHHKKVPMRATMTMRKARRVKSPKMRMNTVRIINGVMPWLWTLSNRNWLYSKNSNKRRHMPSLKAANKKHRLKPNKCRQLRKEQLLSSKSSR